MDERDDLPLDELRAAWRGLDPAPPADELADCDAPTRESVEWMRAAWASLEVPEPAVPAARPRLRLLPRLVAVAAAAAVAWLAWTWLAESAPPVQRTEEVARPEGEDEIAPSELEGPRLAALSSDHVELRSGPVRLILLTDRGQ